jgi:hypothetical protein
LEKWSIDEVLTEVYEAHTEASGGISAIVELKSQSDLLWDAA